MSKDWNWTTDKAMRPGVPLSAQPTTLEGIVQQLLNRVAMRDVIARGAPKEPSSIIPPRQGMEPVANPPVRPFEPARLPPHGAGDDWMYRQQPPAQPASPGASNAGAGSNWKDETPKTNFGDTFGARVIDAVTERFAGGPNSIKKD
jgi:hypothetical protein